MTAELGHSHNQEAANGGTNQRSEDSEYDDRQSMSPFVEKEQRFETFTHRGATKQEDKNTSAQSELVDGRRSWRASLGLWLSLHLS
jgi:hypothetical protein